MIPHSKIIKLIGDKIVCQKTVQLLFKSLRAGYIDPVNGEHLSPSLGTPQGSVISPTLANIILHELDTQMEKISNKFTCGKSRARNKAYDALTSKIQNVEKYRKDSTLIKSLVAQRRKLPSMLPVDPKFKRLLYLRYADDFVILITGSKDDAKMIKN